MAFDIFFTSWCLFQIFNHLTLTCLFPTLYRPIYLSIIVSGTSLPSMTMQTSQKSFCWTTCSIIWVPTMTLIHTIPDQVLHPRWPRRSRRSRLRGIQVGIRLARACSVVMHLPHIPSPGAVLNKTINDQMIDKICNITVLGVQPGVMNTTVPGGTCNKTNNFWSNTYWNDTFTLSLQPETNMTDRYTYCHYYLSTVIPYGSWHWATRNSVVCRLIHVQLTYTVPQIHCRHVGPPGDPYCIDWPQVSCSPLAALSLFQIAVQCPTQA